MSAPHLVQALVLHRRAYGNTSLLLEVFVMERGRIAAIARGARRARSARAALLQPFQPLWLGVSGRGEVRTLGQVEAAAQAFVFEHRSLLCAFYLNELLLRLLPREETQDALFALYHAALTRLASEAVPDCALRHFELQLLAELGYGMALDWDSTSGASVQPHAHYSIDAEHGVRRCEHTAEMPGVRISGTTLLALARGEDLLTGQQHREARTLTRHLLAVHLGPAPLRSRELYRQWQAVCTTRLSASAATQSTREFFA